MPNHQDIGTLAVLLYAVFRYHPLAEEVRTA
jgi:hypothetical protein